MSSPQSGQFRHLNRIPVLACLIAGCLGSAVGCQQPSGQMAIPANPMVGPTRVPPPQTGSIGTPNPYAQGNPAGQVSAGLPASQLGPSAPGTPPTIASVAMNPSGNPGVGVQQASYAETAGFETTSTAPLLPLRPQLRGMEVIDLTPMASNNAAWPPNPALAQSPYPAPASQPNTAPIQPATMNPIVPVGTGVGQSTDPNATGDSWNVVGSGAAQPTQAALSPTPSTTPRQPVTQAAASQHWPWRSPSSVH